MGSGPSDDYYALLGIGADADAQELRRAWRRLVLRWHPDRAGPGATATFQAISAAYAVLSDPGARAAYDRRRGTTARRAEARSGDPVRAPPAGTSRRAPGVMLSRLTGIAMLFVRCKGGVSHNPAESVRQEDVAVAIEVLGRFLSLIAAERGAP